MNEANLNDILKTDWDRIEQMTNDEIDTSDIPPLDDEFFANATLRMPKTKVSVTLHVDSDLVKWYQSQNEDFHKLIDAALKMYADARR
ncbi:BrnA antitoxin family protein [Chroococcus sp. FPU101]|uniref:BrnA antitoxin family protein n=1 Tax=Chroococcus sp. FPU101 TaxID=1974212 RepID=UPI001AAA89A8|nr:BrnA antitoxin family protein [Chroococcus sp. FPU101]GFE70312.1 hypothetical protein CFPU101_29220 [Chroococcus sp. FPU101]